MAYEMELISKLVGEDDPKVLDKHFRKIVESGITQKSLMVKKKEYRTLVEFYRAHKKTPGIKTWKKMFPEATLIKSPEPIGFYLNEIVNGYAYNSIVKVNDEFRKMMEEGKPFEAGSFMVSEIRKILTTSNISSDIDLTKSIKRRLSIYDRRRKYGIVNGIPSGWPQLDNETTGWQRGEFNILVGRMGSFKTWIMIAWCYNAWKEGASPIFFSKEMDWQQIARRFDTYATRVAFREIKAGSLSNKDFKRFKKKVKNIFKGKHPLTIIGTSGVKRYDPEFVRSKIDEYKPDVAFVDGLYLMNPQRDRKYNADYERHIEISRGMKMVAIDSSVPVIGSTQAGRDAASRKKQEVGLHQIAYSDTYGQDADNVIAINRKFDSVKDRWSNKIIVELLKIREGENIKIPINVDLSSMEFTESQISLGKKPDNMALLDEEDDEEEIMV